MKYAVKVNMVKMVKHVMKAYPKEALPVSFEFYPVPRSLNAFKPPRPLRYRLWSGSGSQVCKTEPIAKFRVKLSNFTGNLQQKEI